MKLMMALLMVALCIVPLPGGVAEAASPSSGEEATLPPYGTARECGECHEAIFNAWSRGPHSRSATSEMFLAALARAVEAGASRSDCVWCHAPTTLLTGDHGLQQPLSREGVTCDFCHTIEEVDLHREGHPFDLAPGDIKRGPLEHSDAVGHGTAYSPLHKASSRLCASCHQFTNAAGVAVLSTYDEWREGPYPARGVTCQDCHMAPVPGTTVKESLKAPSSIRVINLHQIVGGSSRSQLDRGLDVEIVSLTRSGGSAALTVKVSNVAAGHPIPGGLSTKSLVLVVGIDMGEDDLRHRQERIYRRELKDDRGRVLNRVDDLFLRAASVGRDNRLRPQETREERFTIAIPQGARAVVARLEYRDVSAGRDAPSILQITEARREFAAR